MLDIDKKQDHLEISIKVNPGSSRNKILGLLGGSLKIAVTAPPEKGKANKEVVQVLAKALGIKGKDIVIVQGQTSQQKTVAVYNCSFEKLEDLTERF